MSDPVRINRVELVAQAVAATSVDQAFRGREQLVERHLNRQQLHVMIEAACRVAITRYNDKGTHR